MTTDNTLFMLLGVQFALYACAWWAYAINIPDDRRATTYWGLFNVLIGIGMLLTLVRDIDRNWLAIVGADIAFVWALLSAWRGIAAFAHIRQSSRMQLSIATLSTLALILLGAGTENATYRVALTYSTAALCIVISIQQCHQPLKDEFDWHSSHFLRLVAMTAAGTLALAAIQQILDPGNVFEINSQTTSNSAILVLLLLIAGVFNFTCLALLLLRYLSQLRNLTFKDPLTGLHNRRSFDEHVASIWSSFQHDFIPVTVSVIDLDNFKQINDQYGHAIGDDVLKLTAKLMKENAREQDIIARFGGEEFVIVLPGTTVDKARIMLERLRHKLETTEMDSRNGNSISITCSIGLSALGKSDEDFNMAIKRADAYMYEAKKLGRNQLYFSNEQELATR